MLTLAILQKLWAHGDQHIPGLLEAIAESAPVILAKYNCNTPLVIAHAMAQFSQECGAGLEMVENLNYSAQGLRSTWPTRFNASRAASYAHNPEMIADAVYGGRMGNAPPPSHDGWDFRGRGLSQVTGREGYEKLGAKVGLDLIEEPDTINDPAHTLECGIADFVLCGCLDPAKADNINAVTKALNGGHIGLADRKVWLKKWKAVLL